MRTSTVPSYEDVYSTLINKIDKNVLCENHQQEHALPFHLCRILVVIFDNMSRHQEFCLGLRKGLTCPFLHSNTLSIIHLTFPKDIDLSWPEERLHDITLLTCVPKSYSLRAESGKTWR